MTTLENRQSTLLVADVVSGAVDGAGSTRAPGVGQPLRSRAQT
jgi:hypothetical protein